MQARIIYALISLPCLFKTLKPCMALAVDTNILPGVTLAYEIRDACILPNYALEQALSFITDREPLKNGMSVGASGVVGTSFSSVSIVVPARLLRLFGIPQINHAATAEVLSYKKTDITTFFAQFHQIHCRQEPLLQLSSSSTGFMS